MAKQDFEDRINALKRSPATIQTIVEVLEQRKDKNAFSKINLKQSDTNMLLIEVKAYAMFTDEIDKIIAYFQDNDILEEEEDELPEFTNQNG